MCSLAPWNPPESGTWTDVHFCACNASDFNCENSVFRVQFARIWAGPHVPIILCTEVASSQLWFSFSWTHLWQSKVELVMGTCFLLFWSCAPLLTRLVLYKKEATKQSGFQFTSFSIVYWCSCVGQIFFKAKPSSRPQNDLKTLIFEVKTKAIRGLCGWCESCEWTSPSRSELQCTDWVPWGRVTELQIFTILRVSFQAGKWFGLVAVLL